MEEGGSGLERLAGDGHDGHAAADCAAALEDEDFGGGSRVRGVLPEEVGDGGAADAGADDADGG